MLLFVGVVAAAPFCFRRVNVVSVNPPTVWINWRYSGLARIAGVDLPKNKHMDVALTYIHGVGRTTARRILDEAELAYNTNSDVLSDADVAKIRKILEAGVPVEGDRRREVSMDIKRLMDSGSYRGLRHRKGLPCRGQRTSTNARTRKGPRRGAGVRRK